MEYIYVDKNDPKNPLERYLYIFLNKFLCKSLNSFPFFKRDYCLGFEQLPPVEVDFV